MAFSKNTRIQVGGITAGQEKYTWSEGTKTYTSLDHIENTAAVYAEDPPEGLVTTVETASTISVYEGLNIWVDADYRVDINSLAAETGFKILARDNDVKITTEGAITVDGQASITIYENEQAHFLKTADGNLVRVAFNSKKSQNSESDRQNFRADVSSILYEDDFLFITWNGGNQQPQFILKSDAPLGGWDRPCFSVIKVDGNTSTSSTSNSSIRRITGRQVQRFDQPLYFSRAGTSRQSNMDLENYGAIAQLHLINEDFVAGFPDYTIDLRLGSESHGSYTITTTNRPTG